MLDVIVIGGGPAGVIAALRAAELGASVSLVEKNRLGGTCTIDGCVPTRVLARAARLAREAGNCAGYGLLGIDPALDFERLMARTQQVVYQIEEKKQLIKHLEESGVEVLAGTGPAHFIDPHRIAIEDGRILEAEKFILCVGGRARQLNFPGAQHALSHSEVWSLKSLPKSILIIGAAATGCQFASIFAALGAQVTLLERSDRILAGEDQDISLEIQKAFEARGIDMLTGSGAVEQIIRNGRMHRVDVRIDEGTRALEAEAVLLAVGWPGNADLLNLEAAGVERARGYIRVDDRLCTTAPHIFAAGDITGRMMLVQSGGYEARIAAENAVLGPGQRYNHKIVPHGGFTDPEYASVGLSEALARQAGHEIVTASVPYAALDRAVIDDCPAGFCKLVVSVESHRILGAHVVGEQALEVIQLVAAGMASDMWVEQLAELEIAYPTFTGILGLAARKAVDILGVMPVAPHWRALDRAIAAEWERVDG